jgi:hypothetical protein
MECTCKRINQLLYVTRKHKHSNRKRALDYILDSTKMTGVKRMACIRFPFLFWIVKLVIMCE